MSSGFQMVNDFLFIQLPRPTNNFFLLCEALGFYFVVQCWGMEIGSTLWQSGLIDMQEWQREQFAICNALFTYLAALLSHTRTQLPMQVAEKRFPFQFPF